MNQDLSMYRPAAFSIIYGLENTVLSLLTMKEGQIPDPFDFNQ